MPKARPNVGALVALFFVQVFFASYPVFGKIALREVSPLVLASFRAVFGAALLWLAAYRGSRHDPTPSWRERGELLLLALLGIVANQLLFIAGLARTSAINTTLLVTSVPVFTVAFGVLLGREKPELRRLLGIPIAFSGVLYLLDPRRFDLHDRAFTGNLMILANCLAYALFLVLSRRHLARRSSLGFISILFLYAAPPILLVAGPDLAAFDPRRLSLAAVLALAAIVVFATVLAYALNAYALARTDATTTAVFIYVQPILATALAWVVLKERPGPRFFVAAALIFAGVALATSPRRSSLVVAAVPSST